MDLVRGLASNALETAKAVLDRKAKEETDTFRGHSTRDVDDQFENLITQAVSAARKDANNSGTGPIPIDLRAAQIAMVLAGERAQRTLKASDEMDNKTTHNFALNLERLMAMVPATPSAEASAAAAAKDAAKDKDNKRPEVLPTPFDGDSTVAIANRAFGVAVRFYAEWGLRLLMGKLVTAPGLARRLVHHLDVAIDNWRPGPGHLTPAHAALAEVCLKTHNAFAASTRLQSPIYEIEPNLSGVTIFDYLDYYFFGGLCYASLERYPAAADFLAQVTLAPARGISVRCIQAAKAHLLVTCIETGEGEYPQSMRFGRHLQELTRDYYQFTETLSKAIHNKNYDASASYNYPGDAGIEGLAQLCIIAIRAVPGHRAQKMTLTYKTVSLGGIAKECGSNEEFAMHRLRTMVQRGALSCKVDRQKGIVTFNEDAATGAEAGEDAETRKLREQAEVQGALQRVMDVNRAVQHRQDMALLSPGLVLATTPQLSLQLELTRKEMESEKGGLLGNMLGGGRRN